MLQEIFALYRDRSDWFRELFIAHMRLCGISILIAGCIGLVLGILIAEHRRFAPPVIGVCNVVYTIPSIALLGMLIPLLGIGDKPAITALCIYGMMPMVRNTYTGVSTIEPELIEAARGMGSTDSQILWRVKLPMAMSVILAGLRSMVVMIIAMGGIAAYIGASSLGVAIFRGISMYNTAMTCAGSILIAALALIADFILSRVEKHLRKKRRMK